jgi:pimeloyl-ACP methyl ester carboxylesterase
LYFYGSLREEISGTMKEANQNFSLKDASLVLLHGFMEDSRIWHSFETALKDSFTVFCPNLPGHGFNPTYLENPSMETYAEYLNAKIPDEKPLILIGHSMGGYVALAFAERYPKRVSGLVLLNSICLADSEARKQERDRSIALMQHNYPLFAKSFVPQIFADSKHPAVDEITEMALQQFAQQNSRMLQKLLWAIPKIIAFIIVTGTHYQFLWYVAKVFLPGKKQLCRLSALLQPARYADILTQKELRKFAISIIKGK